MKNLLFLLLLLPVLSFSQTSSWRTNPPTSNSNSNSSSSPKISQNTPSVSTWRNSEPKQFNRPRTNNSVIVSNHGSLTMTVLFVLGLLNLNNSTDQGQITQSLLETHGLIWDGIDGIDG